MNDPVTRSPARRLLTVLPTLIGLGLLVGAVFVLQREFRHLKWADITSALTAISYSALGVALGWTILAYAILTLYDRVGTIYAGQKLSYLRVAFSSFCATTLAHNLGVAALSGAAVRYRLYAQWGLSPVAIGKVVAFCAFTYGLGALPLGGAILIWEPSAIPFFGDRLPTLALYGIGAAFWAASIGYVALNHFLPAIRLFGHEIALPGTRLAIIQIALASADVAVTSAIFYALLPAAAGLTFSRFLGIYLASYSAGMMASLPGGIGVFDTAILLGLEPYLDTATIVSGIVVFRLYYYLIPLFIAGPAFAGHELFLRSKSAAPPGG